MTVRVDTPVANDARKSVISIILANHSDRCLTCHRVVKCRAGDTCLRDDVVTHRCVTCSKNYRCELQTTCDVVGMANYEPWVGEPRSYYETEPPAADRANPFLEFDPQMCILCSRCVRACDEIRHTGAITVAGKGWDTRIAFGAGGAVDESNCDFCGACIDVCPTATLMEHPNKWQATSVDQWTPTTCSSCSVGCTISLGARGGRGVIVRPEASNPVSRDQICVRGRYHYDAIKKTDYLSQPLFRLDGDLQPTTWDNALATTVDRLSEITRANGPQAMGFLGSPFATTEENYLLQKLARTLIGTNNIDYSLGAVPAAIGKALEASFGTQVLPADMTKLARSQTILVVADDLESSHNVAALRIKDAVVKGRARLIVIASRRGELCDFARAWLQPKPDQEVQMLAALAEGLQTDSTNGASDFGTPFEAAWQLLKEAKEAGADHEVSLVYAMPYIGAKLAEVTTTALANLAIACCGPERAAQSFFVLPHEVNVNGLRDAGVAPDLLPGYVPAEEAGMSFPQMVAAAGDGRLKAMVVMGDNPVFFAPNKERVRQALANLDLLIVIDSLLSDTARMAHIVLPDVATYAKDGTYTNADRRVLQLRSAVAPLGEMRPALHILNRLGSGLAEGLGKTWDTQADAEGVMDEIAQVMSLYRGSRYHSVNSGSQQNFAAVPSAQTSAQPLGDVPAATEESSDGLLLITGRTLYTSLEGATIHLPQADKLHHEEFIEISPQDAARYGIRDEEEITITSDHGELTMRAKIREEIAPGTTFVPFYYDGGAVTALFESDERFAPMVKVAIRATA